MWYWELLFHARVHYEFDRALVVPASAGEDARRAGTTSVAAIIAQRIDELGEREFDEIRNVLQQERFLLLACDNSAVYIEFAAVYLGIRYFKPFLMAGFFPGLKSLDEVDRLIAKDVDAAALLAATRLSGTPEPDELCDAARRAAETMDADPYSACPRLSTSKRSEQKYATWSRRADRQAARAAIMPGRPFAVPARKVGRRGKGPPGLPRAFAMKSSVSSSACKRH